VSERRVQQRLSRYQTGQSTPRACPECGEPQDNILDPDPLSRGPSRLCERCRHGRRGTYIKGCRCEACNQANRDGANIGRYSRAGRTPPPDSHGKATTYTNWHCRCDPCKAAQSQVNRAYHAAHREQARAYDREYRKRKKAAK
jgi:hypothetical protein